MLLLKQKNEDDAIFISQLLTQRTRAAEVI